MLRYFIKFQVIWSCNNSGKIVFLPHGSWRSLASLNSLLPSVKLSVKEALRQLSNLAYDHWPCFLEPYDVFALNLTIKIIFQSKSTSEPKIHLLCKISRTLLCISISSFALLPPWKATCSNCLYSWENFWTSGISAQSVLRIEGAQHYAPLPPTCAAHLRNALGVCGSLTCDCSPAFARPVTLRRQSVYHLRADWGANSLWNIISEAPDRNE